MRQNRKMDEMMGLMMEGVQLHCISYNIPHYVSIEGQNKRAFGLPEVGKRTL